MITVEPEKKMPAKPRILPISLMSAVMLAMALSSMTANSIPPPVSPPTIQETPDPRFMRYTLQAGTALQVIIQSKLDTAVNQPGDPVEAVMSHNLYLGSELLLAKETRFLGVVSRLEPPLEGRHAILAVKFTDILLENGEKLPIAAHVRTEHPEHIWGGQMTPGTKPTLATQRVWGIGEYNRIVFRGPRAMGSQIQIMPGDRWMVILDQPMTLVHHRFPDPLHE